MITKHHQKLITIGCILWILAAVLSGIRIYPYAYIAAYLSPVILIPGVVGWVVHYYKKRGHFPNPISRYRAVTKDTNLWEQSIASFHLPLSYAYHIWVFCILSWMLIAHLFSLYKLTDEFQIAKAYIEKDQTLIAEIGEIKFFGFMLGGQWSWDGDADYSIDIIGTSGKVSANISMKKKEIEEVRYRTIYERW